MTIKWQFVLILIQIVLFVHFGAVFIENGAKIALHLLLLLSIEVIVCGIVTMIMIMHRDLVLAGCVLSH